MARMKYDELKKKYDEIQRELMVSEENYEKMHNVAKEIKEDCSKKIKVLEGIILEKNDINDAFGDELLKRDHKIADLHKENNGLITKITFQMAKFDSIGLLASSGKYFGE
jgi:predicted RNase H-like nuclease